MGAVLQGDFSHVLSKKPNDFASEPAELVEMWMAAIDDSNGCFQRIDHGHAMICSTSNSVRPTLEGQHAARHTVFFGERIKVSAPR